MGTSPGNGGSTNTASPLTEFTKRKNWTRLVLEEVCDLMLILSNDGRMLYVSASSKPLLEYETNELYGTFIADYVHADDKAMFLKEFNEGISSGGKIRFFYRFRKRSGTYAILEAHGHAHKGPDTVYGGPPRSRQPFVFMVSRPYPTRNTALLDSFLEHKIENERLTKRISELKREEQDEQDDTDQTWSGGRPTATVSSPDTLRTEGRANSDAMSTYDGMPPPSKPVLSGAALTRQNLDEALGGVRADSISDKMARYEGATPSETIEMLTGLNYQDGERSHGISTGAASPALIRGDVGIAIPPDRESRTSNDKKKKLKVADEYVCTDCGTLDSPEWRKGPNGPKTLCNACGLRWAKKEKKRQTHHHPPHHTQSLDPSSGNGGMESAL
ncbi:hypothetical protein EJ06DRAFT_474289 [Trichodelitschia bisporula]|uniref:White collar-2 n=1 Tax=Trichodelitschia bisporula TaxID=703511 RepID=A0A6G1I0S6_9PEZI|nr:hypothetical protein EJ06DRAFT_474289 [Trichodelitschia bisporula]